MSSSKSAKSHYKILAFFYSSANKAQSSIIALVVSWGLQKGSKSAFRPEMELSSGELSGLGGKLLMMTATATKKTLRDLQDQFPEVTKWKNILNLPVRKNVTLIVPPTEIVSSKFEETLAPFVHRMKVFKETYLIIVRGEIKC